jgi:hypothetical protein
LEAPASGAAILTEVGAGTLVGMWRGGRRRQAVIANAIADVVHESVLFMRAMAHLREGMCDELFPGSDYQEQIRELADLCDNLVPGLRPGGSRRPVDALQFTWDSRSEPQRRWIRRCVALRGVKIDDLIETAADRRSDTVRGS